MSQTTRKARTVKPYHRTHDGWWYACSARFIPAYGSERVKLLKGPNDKDHEQLATVQLRALLERIEAGIVDDEKCPDDMLVGVLVEEYLTKLEGKIASGQEDQITLKHFEHVKRVLVDLTEHCGYLTCQAFYKQCHKRVDDWLAANTTKGKGKYSWDSSESRRRAIISLKVLFNWGRKFLNLTLKNLEGIKVPDATARITFFTPEQEAAIFKEVQNPRWNDRGEFADFFTMLLETGARTFAEAGKFSCKILERDQDGKPTSFDLGTVKKKRRIVYLSEKAAAIVTRLGEKYPTGPLLRNMRGLCWKNSSAARRIRRIVAHLIKTQPELGLTVDHTLYSTRHTFIVRQMQATGGDAALVAELAGNSIQVIEKHYWKWGTQKARLLSALGRKVEPKASAAALRIVG